MNPKNGERGPPPGSEAPATHQFVVLAYRESPFLEECLAGLLSQGIARADILLCTSTPSGFLSQVAQRHGLQLVANADHRSIGADWNFALAQATAPWVTLVHQDDIYLPAYAGTIRQAIAAHPGAVMVIPWFREFAHGKVRPFNLTHLVKRLLFLRAFGFRDTLSDPRDKLRLLSLGNPVPCGGVAFRKATVPRFDERLTFTLDWKAWLEAARAPGEFVFVRTPIMCRRIHPGSATTLSIETGARQSEELAMFRSLWPRWLADRIAGVYKLGYRTNRVPG
jgi:hypothetical protein